MAATDSPPASTNKKFNVNGDEGDWLNRTRLLLGDPAVDALIRARVAIVGVGGVGGYVVEALARSGIGHLILVDPDPFVISNLNR